MKRIELKHLIKEILSEAQFHPSALNSQEERDMNDFFSETGESPETSGPIDLNDPHGLYASLVDYLENECGYTVSDGTTKIIRSSEIVRFLSSVGFKIAK